MQLLLLSLLTIPCPFFPLSLIDLSLLPKALLLHICYGLSLCRSHYAQRFLDYFVVVNLLQQIHFFVNMIFYRQDSLNVLLRNDGNRVSLLACSRSSSYPVDIVVRICWLTTNSTFGISRPLDATSVAINTRAAPARNLCKEFVLSLWGISE